MEPDAVAASPIIPSPPAPLGRMRVFRTENFPDSSQIPWLDRPDWRHRLQRLSLDRAITPEQTALCAQWAEQGFIIIRGMFDAEELDAAWEDYDDHLQAGLVTPAEANTARGNPSLPDRVLNPHFSIWAFRDILCNQAAVEWVSLLLGAPALPFQTIAGHKGSEQLPHSDSIHMTTYPQGYMLASWIAFEDVTPGSGPLVYYPGSHLLPYTYAKQCGISLEEGRAGYGAYLEKYEPFVQELIAANELQPQYFMAKKGDVLFWHANLLHGGSPIQDDKSSRHALVCHYFAQGVVCYHDYNATSSHLFKMPFLEEPDFDREGYLRLNPDVAAAGMDPYVHYTQFGYKEERRDR